MEPSAQSRRQARRVKGKNKRKNKVPTASQFFNSSHRVLSTAKRKDTPEVIPRSRVDIDKFMQDSLRKSINAFPLYKPLVDVAPLTFHHHISKVKLDEFAANLAAYVAHADQNKALSEFQKKVNNLLNDRIERYGAEFNPEALATPAAKLSKALIQLPFNMYAGFMFSHGNPGNAFDSLLDPNTGNEFEYVKVLRELDDFINLENIPGKGDDDDWKNYFVMLEKLLTNAAEQWDADTRGVIYGNRADWIVRKKGEKTSFAKKNSNIDYKKRTDLLKQQRQDKKNEAVQATLELLDAHLKESLTTKEGYHLFISFSPGWLAGHVVERHSFFGEMKPKLIDTYFHKDEDGEPTVADFTQHLVDTIADLKTGLIDSVSMKLFPDEDSEEGELTYLERGGGEIPFNVLLNQVGIEATLTVELEEDDEDDEDRDERVQPTPRFMLVLKSFFPDGNNFLGVSEE